MWSHRQEAQLCYNLQMPAPIYTLPHRVTLYDLDARDQVSCATLFRYFEETAMRASTDLGFSFDWYKERGQFWVIRTMRLEQNCAARYEDELEIKTWVSAMTRVRADRNYLVTRARDGKMLARATANWVYLDGRTLMPARIDRAIADKFVEGELPALPARIRRSRDSAAHIEGVTARRAQYFEADSARHINNAVYVDWLEEAVREALTNASYALTLDSSTIPTLWFYRHSLDYLSSAVPGDELQITTRLTTRGRSVAEWRQEIHRADTRQLLVRASSTTLWINSQDRVVPWQANENLRARDS